MVIRDAAFEGRDSGTAKRMIQSALACQHIDWRMCHRVRCCPEALACGVFAAGADGQVGCVGWLRTGMPLHAQMGD
jgi:hypothetical protein